MLLGNHGKHSVGCLFSSLLVKQGTCVFRRRERKVGKFIFRDSQSICGLSCRKHWQAWRFWELGGGRLNLALTRKPTSSGLGGIFCCVTCFRIREDNPTCSQENSRICWPAWVSAPESLHQCRLFWALEAQGVVSKHPRVSSIPYFGVCPLADQVFHSTYRGAPQARDGRSVSHAQCKHRCHSAPTGLQETSTTNRLCTGTMQGLWKLQHPGRLCRPTNHLVKWKRMRPLQAEPNNPGHEP